MVLQLLYPRAQSIRTQTSFSESVYLSLLHFFITHNQAQSWELCGIFPFVFVSPIIFFIIIWKCYLVDVSYIIYMHICVFACIYIWVYIHLFDPSLSQMISFCSFHFLRAELLRRIDCTHFSAFSLVHPLTRPVFTLIQ